MWRADSLEKTLMLRKIDGRMRSGWQMVVGWHHQPSGHEFEQTWGDSEGQGDLAFCSPWSRKESDMTEQLNNNNFTEQTSTQVDFLSWLFLFVCFVFFFLLFQLEYIHDGIVQLSEHPKVDGKAGGTVLGGRIAREPRQSVVLPQNKP